MKYVYGFVIIVLLGCSNNSIKTIENKIDVNQLIELNNFRSIKVDSLFQISFPKSFTRTEYLSEEAILQFNNLSKEQHLVILNEDDNSDRIELKELLGQIVSIIECTNEKTNSSDQGGMSLEQYSCDAKGISSVEEYSYWVTRFSWLSESYIVCRWTLKSQKEQFINEAKLIEQTFVLIR